MKYRKLRIAWLAVCGIACLLLIALWVRSYHGDATPDGLYWYSSNTVSYEITSWKGRIQLTRDNNRDGNPYEWARLALSVSGASGTSTLRHFGFEQDARFIGIFIPHWFAVGVTMVIAALSWMRFSLRTLLIAVTLVAVVLGWWYGRENSFQSQNAGHQRPQQGPSDEDIR